MKKALLISLLSFLMIPLQAQDIKGVWGGNLDVNGQKLQLIFHFLNDSTGKAKALMDVPAQGARDIAVEVGALRADSIHLAVPILGMTYVGKLTQGQIKGTFTQSGMALPLDLMPTDNTKPKRPQQPTAPLKYQTEEVTFTNTEAQCTLSGTLSYPVGYVKGQKVPVVLMVTGSGPQNRDEEIYDHKPFAVIADYFARHGIASLRYDDRGVGKSTGKSEKATTRDFAQDARAGIDWLKSTARFKRVGVLGHSEGGMIAFMLAAESVPDFIVCMAAPGIKGDTLMTEQVNEMLTRNGAKAKETVASMRKLAMQKMNSTWMRYFMDYDPMTDIRKVKLPVMAINGTNDVQVLEQSNLQAIKKALSGKHKKNLFKSYPDLNHLFQHCSSKDAANYYGIDETCSEEVMKDMADWILGL